MLTKINTSYHKPISVTKLRAQNAVQPMRTVTLLNELRL